MKTKSTAMTTLAFGLLLAGAPVGAMPVSSDPQNVSYSDYRPEDDDVLSALGAGIPPASEDPSATWWTDGICRSSYWTELGLPDPWLAGSRIGVNLAGMEEACEKLAERGWTPYIRHIEVADDPRMAPGPPQPPGRARNDSKYFALYHQASGRLRTFHHVPMHSADGTFFRYRVTVSAGGEQPLEKDGHLLLEGSDESFAFGNPKANKEPHTFLFATSKRNVWVVYDHQLSYDLNSYNDEQPLYLFADLQAIDEKKVSLKATLSNPSEPVKSAASSSSFFGVVKDLNEGRKAAIKGYNDGKEMVRKIKEAGEWVKEKAKENADKKKEPIRYAEWKTGDDLIKVAGLAEGFIPGAGAVLGAYTVLKSLTIFGGGSGSAQVTFDPKLLEVSGTITGPLGADFIKIPLSTSLVLEVPYYAKVRPERQSRALGLFTLAEPPKARVYRGYFPPPVPDASPDYTQTFVSVSDPACSVRINPRSSAELIETKVMPFDRRVTQIQELKRSANYLRVGPQDDLGDPNLWLMVRVYLKFRLADGNTAEFVRTYKPDIEKVDKNFELSMITEVPDYPSCLSDPGKLTSTVSWAPNRLDVFARGRDGGLYQRWWDGSSWGGWYRLGEGLSSPPVAVSRAADRIDVFGRGDDAALWHKAWDGANWSDWVSLGGYINGPPAAVSWGPNRLDLFVRGSDNSLYHKAWDGALWSGWNSLGGEFYGKPAAVAWGPNRLDVFVRGTDNALYHRWSDGTNWGGWESLGGNITSDPAVASWGTDRLDIFARGVDGALYQKAWDGARWSDWFSHGGVITSEPSVVAWEPNRLDVFVRGADGALHQKAWDGAQWSGWSYHGGAITDGADAVSWGPNRLDIFVRGTDGAVYQKWWDGPNWGGYYNHGGAIR